MTFYPIKVIEKPLRSHGVCLGLSVGFAVLYGFLFWRIAFDGEYAIQEDARQHIFWMQRFVDPGLFPNDLIADYFQSIAPDGYKALYFGATKCGLSPFLFSKVIPPFLGLIVTLYGFYLGLAIIPNPAVSFAFTLMLNQSIWMLPDIASGTARAFAMPLLLAFLYYRTQANLLAIVIVILLQGLFYPHLVFLSVGTLVFGLWQWKADSLKLQWSNDRNNYLLCGLGTIAGVLILLPFVISTSEYSPVISAAEARVSPEFLPGGRHAFFVVNPWVMWIAGRGGIFPTNFNPFFILTGFFLPVILWLRSHCKSSHGVLKKVGKRLDWFGQMTHQSIVLLQFLASSLGLFCVSSVLLFKLHNPNRYTHSSIRIVLTLSAAIVLVGLLQILKRWITERFTQSLGRSFLLTIASTILWGILVFYPATLKDFLDIKYKQSSQGELYHYLQQQPKDIKIASLAVESGNISTFAARSVLVSPEHSIAYHQGYYRQIKARIQDLIDAQYTEQASVLHTVIQKYQITFWLLDQKSFNPEAIRDYDWLQQFQPQVSEVVNQLEQGKVPLLSQLRSSCLVLEDQDITLLDAQCLLNAPS